MKYKYLLFILALFFTYSYTFSQKSEYNIEWEDFEIESRYDPKLVTYEVNESGEYVILKKEPIKGPGGWQYFLEIRDKNLEKVKVEEISSLIDSDRYLINNIIIIDDNIVVFSSVHNKDARNEKFYHQKIDINSLDVSKREEFYTIEYERKRSNPEIFINTSNNGNMLITLTSGSSIYRAATMTKYLLFDNDLETIWEIDKEDVGSDITDAYIYSKSVGNNNDVVFLVGSGGDYSLIRISDKQTYSKELNIKDVNPTGLYLTTTSDDKVFISGYYTEEGTRGIKGVCLWEIESKSLKIMESITTPYSKELLEYSESMKSIKKKNKRAEKKDFEYGVSNISIDNIIIDENKNYYITGSQFRIVEHTRTNSQGGTSTYYTYHYEDIYVTKFDAQFRHVYNAKVPKNTILKRPKDTFSWFFQDGELSYVFIDYKENLNSHILATEGTKKPGKYDKNVVGISTIDATGIVRREILYDYFGEGNKKFVLHKTLSRNGNEILFLAYFGKKQFKIGLLN